MKSVFETKEQYLNFKAAWKKAANNKQSADLNAIHFALYCAVMGKDQYKAFSPVTNKTSLTT